MVAISQIVSTQQAHLYFWLLCILNSRLNCSSVDFFVFVFRPGVDVPLAVVVHIEYFPAKFNQNEKIEFNKKKKRK